MQGQDLDHGTGNQLLESDDLAFLDEQGHHAGACQVLSRPDLLHAVQRGQGDLSQRIDAGQRGDIHPQEAHTGRRVVDAPFLGLAQRDVGPGRSGRDAPGGFILMQHALLRLVHIQMFLAHLQKGLDVFLPHDMPLAENGPFVPSGHDAGDIVTEHAADSVLDVNGFHGSSFHCLS